MTNYSHTPSGTDIFIFGHIGGYSNSKTKMYKFVMKDSNTLVRNYIPALDAYGTPCMFDTVTRTPFYNQGTGEFLYNVKNFNARLPAAYQEVEYLQSSGTQYIDTGVIPNIYDTDISIDCMPLTTNNRMWGVSQWNGTTTLRYREYVTSVGVAYLGSSLSSLSHSVSNRAVIAFIGGKAYNDGVLKMTYSDVDVTFTSSILIFAEFDINTIQKGKSSVYSAKLWESSVLVRDFVPAVRKSDSVAGMYDLVNATFTVNAGTGNFIVGPDVD